MIEVLVTNEFEKQYRRLPELIKLKAKKQERFFCENPFYPALHTEKIEPKSKQVWTIRVDKSYRIAFRFIDSKSVLFLAVGSHDWIYKLKF